MLKHLENASQNLPEENFKLLSSKLFTRNKPRFIKPYKTYENNNLRRKTT